jgi:hypothetical protein
MKRPIETVERLDDPAKEPSPKNRHKDYVNCYRASKYGMRCLNQAKHASKIGPECFKFCKTHFEDALVKVITMFSAPIIIQQVNEISKTSIDNMFQDLYDDGVQIWDEDMKIQLAGIHKRGNLFRLENSGRVYAKSSLEVIVPKLLGLLRGIQVTNFVLVASNRYLNDTFREHEQEYEDYIWETKFVVGKFKDQDVKIPVDDIDLELPRASIHLRVQF